MDDLKTIIGAGLLNYLLGHDLIELDESKLSVQQAGVVSALRELIAHTAEQHPLERTISLGNAILRYLDDQETTMGNVCRLQCGGQLPDLPQSSDEVLNSLVRLGRDIYPGLLLPPAEDRAHPIGMSITAAIFHHPEHGSFCRAVLADEKLRLLFPGADSDLDLSNRATLVSVQSMLIFSSGGGGTFQLPMLAECMLIAAYYRVLLDGPLSPQAYLATLKAVLRDVRKIASGQICDVPVIFGFTNIDLPPGTSVSVPTGRLCGADGVSSALLPPRINVSAVLVTKTPMRLLHVEPYDPQAHAGQNLFAMFERFKPQIAKSAVETDRVAELLRLAFLLASPSEGLFAVRNACRTILDPLEYEPTTQWRNDSPISPSPMAGLGGKALERVQEWAQKTKGHPKRLDIAMRRTLSASAERADPHDGFIDAVLAWENMFSGRPETNLRVCGAIAWLLEPDSYVRRKELFDEVKGLYTKRSNLVHGSIETVADVVACRDRAVRISVESMRCLYSDPALLQVMDSAERGGMILMGGTKANEMSADDSEPGTSA